MAKPSDKPDAVDTAESIAANTAAPGPAAAAAIDGADAGQAPAPAAPDAPAADAVVVAGAAAAQPAAADQGGTGGAAGEAQPQPSLLAEFEAAMHGEFDRIAARFGIARHEVIGFFRNLFGAPAAPEAAPPLGLAPVAGKTRVEVKGPRDGIYRAGHHFTAAAKIVDVTDEQLDRIKADPALTVSVVPAAPLPGPAPAT